MTDATNEPCICGEPQTAGSIHRQDGPCYQDELATAPIGAGEPHHAADDFELSDWPADDLDALKAEDDDQAAVQRLSATCDLVMAEGVDLWAFTGFTDPTGQHGIESCKLAFTGIDDQRQLHFAFIAVQEGTAVEITTHEQPENIPMPWYCRADANAVLVQGIVSKAGALRAKDARMKATGQLPA